MLTLVLGLLLRMVCRLLTIRRERYCPGVGWGFVHHRMAVWLLTNIQMVLVQGFASTQSLASIVACRIPNSSVL